MKIILFLSIIIFINIMHAQNILSGTVLLGIWTDNELVIGVDGKEIDKTDPLKSIEVCKILEVNNIVFAISGLPRYAPTNLDVLKTISNICKNSTNIDEIINSVSYELKNNLSIAAQDITKRFPHLSEKDYESLSVGVFLGCFYKNVHSLFIFLFRFKKQNNSITIETEFQFIPPEPSSKGWKFYGLGHSEYAEEYVKLNQDFIYKNPQDAMRKMLLLQIEKDNLHCGLPLNMVSLKNNNISWIIKSEQCTE